ncbi:hypothetical protein SAMN05720473_10164 [Fibrobacter sp. UWB15]|jgi:hypothetical protein|uniref:hypothetical protein n=1 Tax=unclassified Fibrobacter TaxID=2634177 RepID=UPI000920D797|nr:MULTISPECIES: hypothetical protein [unclassified Fibrobacter]PWJ67194.1 hypothetical protein BGW99_10164 [Fibrobacter sp. UWB6]SHF60811.1 hypothetical protein SAMN05720760_10129 [Fibrobacter sp. UWB8]SMG07658.1 hypothetical protein SAMN05720473_10164 [Fibrobacter sp. UWB15]
MIRKLIGFASILALALAFVGCGTASTESDDHCTVDPNAPDCVKEEPAADPAGEP